MALHLRCSRPTSRPLLKLERHRVSMPTNPASAAENLRRLYPIYSALAREFVMEPESHPGVAEPASEEWIGETEQWFAKMDERIKAHQIRQFVQTSPLVNGDTVRDLLLHHLARKVRNEDDRDKIEFLLVQLLSEYAPRDLSDSALSLQAAVQVLEPVLGPMDSKLPEPLEALEKLLEEAQAMKSLKALFTSRIIEQGRELKSACGDQFFQPLSMAAIARFGLLVRNVFFRLMQQDLNVILDALRELEERGVTMLDCRKAQFGMEEPVSRVRMICQSWKVMFHAEYSSGQPLCILVDLRTVVESALGGDPKAQKAHAAKVGSQRTSDG